MNLSLQTNRNTQLKGRGVEVNYPLAKKWYKAAAADSKDPAAQFALGNIYEKGLAGKQNDLKALSWHRKAILSNHVPSLCSLGALLMRGGQGVPASPEQGLAYLLKAAEQNYAPAQYQIGVYYHKINPDSAQAQKWLTVASQRDHTQAQYLLATILLHTHPLDQKTLTEALHWLYKAAESGRSSEACAELGRLYHDGKLMKPDYEVAILYYQQAANAGYPQAQNALGLIYRDGITVPQNYQKAFHHFKAAAENSFGPAMCNLAMMYKQGLGVEADEAQYMKWIQTANSKI